MKITTIDLLGQLADLKEVDYKNTLAIAALMDVLVEKGIITKREISQKAQELEATTEAEIAVMSRSRL